MARKTSPRKRKRPVRKRPDRGPLKLWLASLFLVVFLLAALILIGKVRQWYAGQPRLPAEPTVATSSGSLRNQVREELEGLVAAANGPPGAVELTGPARDWTASLKIAAPDEEELAHLAGRLAGLGLSLRPAGPGEFLVLQDGRAVGRLRFLRPDPVLPRETPGPRPPQVAIIVDDLGRDLETFRSLLDIELPLALAILPGEPHATEAARLAHRRGREVMIHLPMEPQGYPAIDPGDDALLVGQPPSEQLRRMRIYLRRVPHAVGVNNHMGSRFTEDLEGMAVVLGELRREGLFFVDSRTTGGSVAYELGRRAGIRVGRRDVFLDNVAEEEPILEQIRQLVRTARRSGTAIAICHPYPATLKALHRAVGLLEEEGIAVVPVSRLVAKDQTVP